MTTSENQSVANSPVDALAVVTELGFLRACFESLVYVAPEGIPRIQAQIANSLSKLAACALLETVTRSSRLIPLTEVEVKAIADGFKGSLSQLVRDAASAQRVKADFQLSRVG